MQGRSATDGSDQLRKKMCIADRRVVRAGVKGILFVLDLAFTNACTMWCYVNRNNVKNRAEFETKYNKVCVPIGRGNTTSSSILLSRIR